MTTRARLDQLHPGLNATKKVELKRTKEQQGRHNEPLSSRCFKFATLLVVPLSR